MEKFPPEFSEGFEERDAAKESSFAAENETEEEYGFISRYIKHIVENKQTENETLGYKSQVSIYGGELKNEPDGKLVWNNMGLSSKFDRWGDRVLRAWDEHFVKDPLALLERNPRMFFHMLPIVRGPKRFRGDKEQIMENVKRLGLEEYYGMHKNGIEIKDPDIYKKGVNLQDIFHADQIDSPKLSSFDRFAAVEQAGEYLSSVHANNGAIGEMLANDIVFMEYDPEKGILRKPILNIPDEIYDPERSSGETEKMATDLLDFLVSIGAEEWRRSDNPENVKKILDHTLARYDVRPVLAMTESLARRGRLTMPGEEELQRDLSVFAQVFKPGFQIHNVARLNVNKNITTKLRDAIIAACEDARERLARKEEAAEERNDSAERRGGSTPLPRT